MSRDCGGSVVASHFRGDDVPHLIPTLVVTNALDAGGRFEAEWVSRKQVQRIFVVLVYQLISWGK